jgi:hypothetical protein
LSESLQDPHPRGGIMTDPVHELPPEDPPKEDKVFGVEPSTEPVPEEENDVYTAPLRERESGGVYATDD